MKNVLVSSFFGFILLYSFDGYFDKKVPVTNLLPEIDLITLNPLDAILGEKKMDDGTFRNDNFQAILKIKASFLKDSSKLYRIQSITKDLFLLTRKAFYYNNRSYSLFVKTLGEHITFCHPVIDFPIKGVLYSNQKIYLISDDYSEIAKPWRPTYTVKISCIDSNFNELWTTSSIPNKGYFFYGTRLEFKNDQLVAGIGINSEGSSTMCVDEFDLTLSESGKITDVVYTGGYSCGGRSTSESSSMANLFKSN